MVSELWLCVGLCAADNEVLLVKEGAHEAIVAAMRAHPHEAAVQEKACGALLFLGCVMLLCSCVFSLSFMFILFSFILFIVCV